ncbi:hypothetical protein ACVWWR_008279 [Bradyrhizobium sp. LM3.2]
MALAAMLFGMSAAAQAGEGRLLYASLGERHHAFADRLGRILCG